MQKYTFSRRQVVQLQQPRVIKKDAVVLFGEVLADVFPDKTVLGGAPFNVARHLQAFGQNPFLITGIGHDALGDEVLKVMSQSGMETLGVQRCDAYPTGLVKVHILEEEHQFEILPSQAYDFIDHATAFQAALSIKPVLFYFGTLAQRQEVSNQALMSLLQKSTTGKFLDINLRAPWYEEKILRQSLHYADIVKLNGDELAVLVEMFKVPGRNPREQVREILNKFAISQAVVTCGETGAWQIDQCGEMFQAGVKKRIAFKLVDTVGAGDGFSAVYLLGTLRRWPITTILERANAFAAAICEIRGAVPDHPDFYAPFYREWYL